MGKAIVFGADGGIGRAVSDELEKRGTKVMRLSRNSAFAIDLLNEGTVANAARAIADEDFSPDLIFIATGILHREGLAPEKSVRELDPDWMMLNFRINAIGPTVIAKHFLPLMPRDRRICFAVLSARVGSISDNRLGGWHSYRASKAALNMLIRNLSIEWQRKNALAVVVGLHPGTVQTALSAPFKGDPAQERFTPQMAARQLLDVLETIEPYQSGQLFGYDGTVIAA